MSVTTPCLHNLGALIAENKCGLELEETWEIGTQPENDVIWSVVLAYLHSSELQRRLQKIVGDDEAVHMKEVRKSLKKYNPFLNRRACFYDENFKNVVSIFRRKIEQETHNKRHDILQKIHTASRLLSCRIAVVLKTNWSIKCFPLESANQTYTDTIILFLTKLQPSWKRRSQRCTFGLCKKTGYSKQDIALRVILTPDVVQKRTLFKICALPGIRDNFIVSILNSTQAYIIPSMYKSSYVLGKLSDAGFETDPTVEDSEGHSALYYALRPGRHHFIYVLYEYVANACQRSENTLRSPDSTIVDNLMCLKDKLGEIQHQIENSKDMDEEMRKESGRRRDEVCLFNRFQIEVSGNIHKLRQQINYYESSDTLFDANKRKCIILSIMDSYSKFFNWSDSGENDSKDLSTYFDDYIKYSDYFDNLDFSSALLFFDNMFSLKERVLISDNQYLKIESEFFSMVFCIGEFSRHELVFNRRRKKLSRFSDCLRFTWMRLVPFLQRKSLLTKLCHFTELLRKTEIDGGNTVLSLPKSEVNTLTNLPEIRNEFLVCRLNRYIDAATRVTVKDVKSILVIQRALQVVGETLKSDPENPYSIGHLICSSLPCELTKHLRKIRPELSHLRPTQLYRRNSVEKNESLFVEVQKELKAIKEFLSPVRDYQSFRMQKYILMLALSAVRQAMNEKLNFETSLNLHVDWVVSNSNEITAVNRKNFLKKTVYQQLSCIVSEMCRNNEVLVKKRIVKYERILKNVISTVNRTLTDSNLINKSTEDLKTQLNEMFWPLECLLKFIITDSKTNSNIRKEIFKEVHKRLHACRTGIRDKNLITTETDSSEREIGEQRDSLNNSQNLIDLSMSTLLRYEKHVEDIFSDLKYPKRKTMEADLSCQSIEKLKKILMGAPYLSEQEKEDILGDLSARQIDAHLAKERLKSSLTESECLLSPDEASREISKLILKEATAKELLESYDNDCANAMTIVESSPDVYSDLEEVFERSELGKKQYELLCSKAEFSEVSKQTLGKLVKGQRPLQCRNKLEFLKRRIQLLKQILIDDNSDIKNLWERAKSPKTKQYTVEKIVRLYLSDPEVQASVEMLLFDCMNVLKDNGLKMLWNKTSYLFNGIDVRNVLAHGNPLLESVCKLLDPEDLPSELIRKMLSLISDAEVIDDILNLVTLTKANFSRVCEMMNDEEEHEHKDLCNRISQCDKWKNYVFLIEHDRKESSSSQ